MTICYGQTESSPVITQTRADDPFEIESRDSWTRITESRSENCGPGTDEEVAP